MKKRSIFQNQSQEILTLFEAVGNRSKVQVSRCAADPRSLPFQHTS